MKPAQKSRRSSQTWQSLHAEVSRRISEGVWKPGELIPGEVELAEEFGCARATVNRALRQLAEEGFLDRRRKAGTRVALHPVRKATLDISITRLEVEQRGAIYSHQLLEKKQTKAPAAIRNILTPHHDTPLHIRSLHLADDKSFMYEDRWVNVDVVPDMLKADLNRVNANEWLVGNALFTTGEIAFSAANASTLESEILQIEPGAAIFVVDRITWNGQDVVTIVRLAYAPGFRLQTTI